MNMCVYIYTHLYQDLSIKTMAKFLRENFRISLLRSFLITCTHTYTHTHTHTHMHTHTHAHTHTSTPCTSLSQHSLLSSLVFNRLLCTSFFLFVSLRGSLACSYSHSLFSCMNLRCYCLTQ